MGEPLGTIITADCKGVPSPKGSYKDDSWEYQVDVIRVDGRLLEKPVRISWTPLGLGTEIKKPGENEEVELIGYEGGGYVDIPGAAFTYVPPAQQIEDFHFESNFTPLMKKSDYVPGAEPKMPTFPEDEERASKAIRVILDHPGEVIFGRSDSQGNIVASLSGRFVISAEEAKGLSLLVDVGGGRIYPYASFAVRDGAVISTGPQRTDDLSRAVLFLGDLSLGYFQNYEFPWEERFYVNKEGFMDVVLRVYCQDAQGTRVILNTYPIRVEIRKQ